MYNIYIYIYIYGITCLTLLVRYGLVCCMRVVLRQGSSHFATLFAPCEERMSYTSSVRQVIPPPPISALLLDRGLTC